MSFEGAQFELVSAEKLVAEAAASNTACTFGSVRRRFRKGIALGVRRPAVPLPAAQHATVAADGSYGGGGSPRKRKSRSARGGGADLARSATFSIGRPSSLSILDEEGETPRVRVGSNVSEISPPDDLLLRSGDMLIVVADNFRDANLLYTAQQVKDIDDPGASHVPHPHPISTFSHLMPPSPSLPSPSIPLSPLPLTPPSLCHSLRRELDSSQPHRSAHDVARHLDTHRTKPARP